jgi:small ligand-binding sensory domain FIST
VSRAAKAMMRWVASHSLDPDPIAAVTQAAGTLRAELGPGPVDLVMAFFTRHLATPPDAIGEALQRALAPGCRIGVSAGAVVTTDREIEQGPALSLIAARLPGVEVEPFLLDPSSWGEAMDDPLEFAKHTRGVDGAELLVLFGDPFTLDIERTLVAFNRHAPGLRVVGGMASAGMRPNANLLFLNDWTAHEGGVAVALSGALRVDVVVSQGCRPIGPPLAVTRVDQNVILELDGQPALERAEQVLRELPESEHAHLRHGLYVGRPARVAGGSGRGDYLIRNLLGADRDRGALAVGDRVVEQERVRLHVRDASIAIEDLEMLLSPQAFDSKAQAALMFSCNGRGTSFFGQAHRDVATLQDALGGVPLAGFFAAGEIGPVGDHNYLHGQTASIAIVRPR